MTASAGGERDRLHDLERDARRRDERRAAEHGVMRILASVDTIEAAAPQLLEAVCRCAGWELGELWMADRRAGVLRLTEAWSSLGSELAGFVARSRALAFAPGVGLPGRVWASGEPAWVEDVTRDANFPRAATAVEVGLHAAFGFPIRIRDEVIGAMTFYVRSPREPDVELLASLDVVGNQIGGFIDRQRIHAALRASEARWQRVYAGAPVGIFHTTPGGRVVDVNPAAAAMLGYASPAELIEDLGDRSIAEALYDDPPVRARVVEQVMRQRGRWVPSEVRLRRKDGDVILAELQIKWLDESDGEPAVLEGFLTDITARDRAERERRAAEATFRTLFEGSADSLMLLAETGVFVECNQSALALLGVTREQLLHSTPADLAPPRQPDGRPSDEVAREMIAQARERGLVRFDWTIRDAAGREHIVDMSLVPVVIAGRTMLHTSCRDITERTRLEEELQRALDRVRELTLRDALTDLFNRRHLEARLEVEVSYALRHGQPLAVAMFDVDHFKEVNDTHGHAIGDAVLRHVADTLGRHVRPEDVLARYGGEEFVLLLRHTDADGAWRSAERVRAAVEGAPFVSEAATLRITVSGGVASLAECEPPCRDELMRVADVRLYEAKQRGRNRVVGPGPR